MSFDDRLHQAIKHNGVVITNGFVDPFASPEYRQGMKQAFQSGADALRQAGSVFKQPARHKPGPKPKHWAKTRNSSRYVPVAQVIKIHRPHGGPHHPGSNPSFKQQPEPLEKRFLRFLERHYNNSMPWVKTMTELMVKIMFAMVEGLNTFGSAIGQGLALTIDGFGTLLVNITVGLGNMLNSMTGVIKAAARSGEDGLTQMGPGMVSIVERIVRFLNDICVMSWDPPATN